MDLVLGRRNRITSNWYRDFVIFHDSDQLNNRNLTNPVSPVAASSNERIRVHFGVLSNTDDLTPSLIKVIK